MRLKTQATGSPRAIPRIAIWAYRVSDGTDGLTGSHLAKDAAEAQRAWPSCRRRAWSQTHVGDLPQAARVWDGLTTSGHALLWETWQLEDFPVAAVLLALESDREALRRFQASDPSGAAAIGDFLALFEKHLDRVEAEAHRIAARPNETRWSSGAPDVGDVRRYGEAVAAG